MIDIEFLERLIRTLDESGIDHIEIERGGTRLRVSKTPSVRPSSVAEEFGSPVMPPRPPTSPQPVPEARSGEVGPREGGGDASAGVVSPGGSPSDHYSEITSPMVGTFYRASSPDSDPFADVGSRIRSGDPLCIIEAMKLMNELEAEIDGVIREICVANGEPVEYGQVLFRVEPA